MKNFMLIEPFVEMFKDASQAERLSEKVLQYILATWATGLFILAVFGLSKIFYELITNPGQFEHVTWGLIDYIP